MKFSQQFEASQFPEWKKKYFRYSSIRSHINSLFPKGQSARSSAPDDELEDAETGLSFARIFHNAYGSLDQSYNNQINEQTSMLSVSDRSDQILTKLLSELHKMDSFYRTVESELETGLEALKSQINLIAAERTHAPYHHRSSNSRAAAAQKARNSSNPSLSSTMRETGRLQPKNNKNNPSLTKKSSSANNLSSMASSDGSTTPPESPAPDAFVASGNRASSLVIDLPVTGNSMHHSQSSGTSLSSQTESPQSSHSGSSSSSNIVTNGHSSTATTVNAASSNGYNQNSLQASQMRRNNALRNSILPDGPSASLQAFSSHFFHPLHPDGAHRRRHSVTDEDLSAALLPLKATFIHLLRRMTMLIHFVDINVFAVTRLLKMFETRSGNVGIEARFTALMKSKYFCTSRKLEDELIPSTYQLFADYFEKGDVDRARVLLLNQLSEAEYDRADTFVLGLKIGIVIMLIIWNIMILIRPAENMMTIRSLGSVAPVYRSLGLLLVLLWLWGIAVAIFDYWRISYVFVFQINPRNRLTHFAIFNEASNMSIVYLVNALLLISHYEQALDRHLSYLAYPASLFFYFIVKLFTPSPHFSHWDTRSTLLGSLFNVMIAPFGTVKFRESYVGDVLTSMVKILVDIEASVVVLLSMVIPYNARSYAATGSMLVPLICCLPLWFRLMQCLRRYYDTKDRWPHFANAMKYAVSHSVVIVSVFHPAFSDHHQSRWALFRLVWLASTIASTLYTFVWDVTMDWGLSLNITKLRPTLLFTNRWFYYWAIISNFFLRFGWVITLVPFDLFESPAGIKAQSDSTYLSYLAQSQGLLIATLASLELFRRFQWTLIRVEWEQINNGSGFRLSYYQPMFFQQRGAGSQPATKEVRETSTRLIVEVISMVAGVLVIAVIGALV